MVAAHPRQNIIVVTHKIYSFRQCLHDESTNPVRLVEIDTAANTVYTKIYVPWTNTSYAQYDTRLTGVNWIR